MSRVGLAPRVGSTPGARAGRRVVGSGVARRRCPAAPVRIRGVWLPPAAAVRRQQATRGPAVSARAAAPAARRGAGSGNDPTTGPHPRTEGASTFVKTLLTPDSHQIHVSAHAYTTRSREGGERRRDGRKTALLTRLRPRLAQPPSSPTRQNCATDSTKHTPSPRP